MARVRDVMTARVVTVSADSPVSVAVERMARYGFSALPVVTGSQRLVGIVSLLDILRHRELGVADDTVPVGTIMNPDVLSMRPMAKASMVAQRMRSHGELRVMPIVEGGVLIGVVTRSDLLRPPRRPGPLAPVTRWFHNRDAAHDEQLLALARPRRPHPPAEAWIPVREVMTTSVVTIGTSAAAEEAAELLLRHRLTALPVVTADGQLVGVISEADLLALRHGTPTVGAVMSRRPITLGVDATVGDARALVADRGLRMVPVVDGGRVVGVVSRGDLL